MSYCQSPFSVHVAVIDSQKKWTDNCQTEWNPVKESLPKVWYKHKCFKVVPLTVFTYIPNFLYIYTWNDSICGSRYQYQ